MKLSIQSLMAFSMLLSGCSVNVGTISLKESYMTGLHREEAGETVEISGRPVLKYKNGYLHEGLYWWGGEGLQVTPQKTAVEISCINIGPNYTPFGSDLPLLDFIKQPVAIRITARAEGKDGDVPLLSVQFDDANGRQANGQRPEARIGNTGEFMDYYFDCSNIWKQTWPDNQTVNGAIVNKVLFFINPGASGYTGKLFIKEIRAVPLDSIKPNPEFKITTGIEGGMVDNFEGPALQNWSGGENYTLSKSEEGALKVVVKNAGPGYPSFGKKLDKTMNMKNAYKIRLRVRFEGEGYPELRVDAKDYKGYITNGKPASNWLEPTENRQYRDYLFIYKDNWFQAFPDRKELDPERITDLLFFVNPGKNAWSGIIYIDAIEVIYTGSSGRNSER